MSSHYFDATPSAASRPHTIALTLPDVTLSLQSDRGVFSSERIDPGTKYLLIEAPTPPASARHGLDLGCGYGPIAVTLATRAPDCTVWAVDVNERAVELCRANAAAAGLDNVRVALVSETDPFDQLPDEVRFDVIWSNPPIRIGKPALHALLDRWLERLTPDGHAYLVVQKHLGSDSLQAWLQDQGCPVERLGSRAGYRLLAVGRPGSVTSS
jgi:16S rRNA (guanine1207-N2)-methyltransferase